MGRGRGRIAIDRRLVWLALAAVPFLAFVGVMATRQGSGWIGVPVLLLALFGGAGVLPGLSSRLDLVWDAGGVEGPCQVWGPYIGFGRARLAWDEIVAIGGTAAGYAWLGAADGRRVYWTEQHRGHQDFLTVLTERRPDLLRIPDEAA